MYSYDVPASPRRSTPASRSIPGMRPSYDAEHPHSTTPIYDELYSEYRRLFRALPGDRSGEEDLAFTGFAVRDAAPGRTDPRPYPPQHQAFQTYAGQAIGIPQFMPPRPGGPDHAGPPDQPFGHTGPPHDHGPAHGHRGHDGTGPYTSGFHPAPAPGRATGTQAGAQSGAQAGTGQGWIAAGYLGPVPQPTAAHVPAPAPVTVPVPAPAPAVGTTSGGRHRSLLSLPPGRGGDHH